MRWPKISRKAGGQAARAPILPTDNFWMQPRRPALPALVCLTCAQASRTGEDTGGMPVLRSSQNLFHDPPVNVSQSKIASGIAIGELFVIESERR